MKTEDEIIYKLLGTTHSPSENRENFAKNIQLYLKACEKVKMAKIFEERYQDLFDKNQNLESIAFEVTKVQSDYYDIVNLVFEPRELINNEDLKRDFYEIIYEEHYMLDHLYKYKESRYLIINRDKLKNTSQIFLNEAELDMFNRIENFEKSKLEKLINTTDKKTHTMKV